MMKPHTAKLKHITPHADDAIAEIARVSNAANEHNRETYPRLIRYLIDHQHWSPFETVHATVECFTTRDIGRQLLRHRSFSFQEFSGRYAAYEELLEQRQCRFQDHKNRQNSFAISMMSDKSEEELDAYREHRAWWDVEVAAMARSAEALYKEALERGVAKEVARAILPEGLVPTRIYVCGPIRSFIHYCKERLQAGVQWEHQLLAGEIFVEVFSEMPMLLEAVSGYIDGPTVEQVKAAASRR